MKMKVKRLTDTAKLPEKANRNDAGFDLYTDESFYLKGHVQTISTGIALEIPEGYYGRLVGRSGLTSKSPIRVIEGVIDSDYRGEIKVMITSDSCSGEYEHGLKIAQLIIQPLPSVELVEVEELSTTGRGKNGFGSTGY